MTGKVWLNVLEMAFRTEKQRTEKMMERMARKVRSTGGGALLVIAAT